MSSILKSCLVLAWLCSLVSPTAAQSQFGDLEPGPFAVGYKVISTHDYGRTFDTPKYNYKGEFQEGERARPMLVSVWFPAARPAASEPMEYGEYYYPPSDDALTADERKTALDRVKAGLGPNVDAADFDRLMAMPTAVVKRAKPADGAFPLLVFAQGFGQQPSSQNILSEYLASHGYIVASSPSQGHRGPMTFSQIGSESQLQDMEFIIRLLHDFPSLDRNRLGVMGFSYGGIPCALLMMKNSDVDAFLSLDSSIGTGAGFTGLFQSPFFNPDDLRSAVLHLYTDPAQGEFNSSFLDSLEYAPTYVIKLENLRHADFSSYGKIASMVPNFGGRFVPEVKGDPDQGQTMVARYALEFFDAYGKQDQTALMFMRATPEKSGFPADLVRAEIHTPEFVPPGARDIAAMIEEGEVTEVVELYRQYQERDPDLELFEENMMNMAGYGLVGQGRLDEAIEIFRLNIEAFPDSWNCYDSLGEAYAAQGKTELAIEYYSKALEMNEGDQRIIDILENLRNPQADNG